MHICLLPTEILLRIFTINIPESNIWIIPVLRAPLAVLAGTCRKFKEPALDILWGRIIGFKPLISCLPEGVCNRDRRGKLTLQRPLLAGEWRLIHQYARRVRSFAVNGSQLDMIDNHVMQAFMSAPSSLFPNLRRLCWHDDREHFFPLLCTLLRPTITSIQANFISASPTFAQSALFASLGSLCPSTQELGVALCIGDSAESSDAICKALCSLRELSHLETGALNRREFLRLASLPPPKSLYFRMGTYDTHEMQSNSTTTIFSQLDQVNLTASSPSVIEHFLRSVRLPSCRSAQVCLDHDNLQYNPEILYNILHIPDLIVSLSECLSPALEKLHIEFESDFRYIREDIDRNYVLGFDAVAPLLPFNRLTDLRLDWMCTSGVNDASIKILAQSWPQLEQFYFRGTACWAVPPSMTFTALVHLIQHCPRLHDVQITFCATPVDYDNDPFFFETVPNEKITTLSVGMSPISDPCTVVYILLRLLPKLGYVDSFGWFHDDPPTPPPFEPLVDGWIAVNEILKVKNPRRLK
ncbi:hypothetical protein BDR03DRAFT_653547 [Suillus americanus]|nr:hypothetical protein BDR03DRAFT_653547 [Suillus americanus]